MYCRFCGAENTDESIFCKKCGAKIIEVATNDPDATAQDESSTVEAPVDIYQKLKLLEDNNQNYTLEYDALMKKEKKAYFWFKMSIFVIAVSTFFFTHGILGDMLFSQRILNFVIGIGVAVLVLIGFNRIEKITGIKVGFTRSEETSGEEKAREERTNYFFRCVNQKHAGAIRVIAVLNGIAFALAVIYLVVCLCSGSAFRISLEMALILWCTLLIICTGIWTFKAAIVLVILALSGILLLFPQLDSIYTPDFSGDTASSYNARESSCVTLNGARLDKDNGQSILVISYTWTNLTDSATSAAYSVAIHAYQNGVELKKAYFSDIDDELWTRNIKPDTTIDLEIAFYIDDTSNEVSVEATPWIALDGEVYTSKIYTWY